MLTLQGFGEKVVDTLEYQHQVKSKGVVDCVRGEIKLEIDQDKTVQEIQAMIADFALVESWYNNRTFRVTQKRS